MNLEPSSITEDGSALGNRRTCSFEACSRTHTARGYCPLHYKRVLRHGNPAIAGVVQRSITTSQRFAEKYTISKDGCWLWVGAISDTGYGSFWDGEKSLSAHRHSYESTHGKQPSDMHLDHLCRVRRCVNPVHLELVTPRENLRRGNGGPREFCKNGHSMRVSGYLRPDGKGRMCRKCATVRGRDRYREQNPDWGNGNVSDEKAQEIAALSESGLPQRKIALLTGVAQSTVSRVVRRVAKERGVRDGAK